MVGKTSDAMHSKVDCTLEGLPHPPAVRLGFRLIDRLKAESAERIVDARAVAPFDSAEDLARGASLEQLRDEAARGGRRF